MIKPGFINVIKPTGMTSNDLVAKIRGMIRRAYGKKIKVGHTGTLDPNAAGVMLVAIGSGTKFSQYVMEKNKTYFAKILFGMTTDTLDTYGVLEERGIIKEFHEKQVQQVLKTFEGTTSQIPPKYSALKVDGQRLYHLAREGKDIPQIKARDIFINSIELTGMDQQSISINVNCSSGTYIRSLAYDIAQKLDNLGTLSLLIRTDVDGYKIQDGVMLEDLESIIHNQQLDQVIINTEKLLDKFPALVLKSGHKLYLNGATISTQRYMGQSPENGHYRVFDKDGTFLGIGLVKNYEETTIKSETMAR